jgi:hypothetical protein
MWYDSHIPHEQWDPTKESTMMDRNPHQRTYRLDTLRGTRGRSARNYRAVRAQRRGDERDAALALPGFDVDPITGAGMRQVDLACEIDANAIHTFGPEMADTTEGIAADRAKRARILWDASERAWALRIGCSYGAGLDHAAAYAMSGNALAFGDAADAQRA